MELEVEEEPSDPGVLVPRVRMLRLAPSVDEESEQLERSEVEFMDQLQAERRRLAFVLETECLESQTGEPEHQGVCSQESVGARMVEAQSHGMEEQESVGAPTVEAQSQGDGVLVRRGGPVSSDSESGVRRMGV